MGFDTSESTVGQLSTKVGIVLEDPETQLFTTSVLSEVAFGPENLCVPVPEIMERVKWVLEVVQLSGYENRMPTALSGGQKQRLAIAAALSMRPSILVLDESTSQIDPLGVKEVYDVVLELNKKHGMTIVMATDQSEEIARVADRVLVLDHGRRGGIGNAAGDLWKHRTVQAVYNSCPAGLSAWSTAHRGWTASHNTTDYAGGSPRRGGKSTQGSSSG